MAMKSIEVYHFVIFKKLNKPSIKRLSGVVDSLVSEYELGTIKEDGVIVLTFEEIQICHDLFSFGIDVLFWLFDSKEAGIKE